MNRLTDQKVVVVTQKTRLFELVRRYNTVGQAQFYVEHHGGDFRDYLEEDRIYNAAVNEAISYLQQYGRVQIVDRGMVPAIGFNSWEFE